MVACWGESLDLQYDSDIFEIMTTTVLQPAKTVYETLNIGDNAKLHLGDVYYASAPGVEATVNSRHLIEPIICIPFGENSAYIDRGDTLDKINDAFTISPQLAIVGVGGIGKTELAAAYCQQAIEIDPQLSVFWIHGDSPSAFLASYFAVAEKLGCNTKAESESLILDQVKRVIENKITGNWLMVIDNADDYSVFQTRPRNNPPDESPEIVIASKPLLQYIPKGKHGRLLITSRVRSVGHQMAGKILSLNSMSVEEAKALVTTKLSPDVPDDHIVEQLCERLEFNPLAISQACAFITYGLPAEEYLQYLQSDSTEQINVLRETWADSRRRQTKSAEELPDDSIIQTWLLSFHQISLIKGSQAIEVLGFLCQFQRHAIPISLVRTAFGSAWSVDRAITTLCEFELITRRQGKDLIDMHRFTQLTARAWLEDRSESDIFIRQALSTFRDAAQISNDEDDTTSVRLLIPHGEELQQAIISEQNRIEYVQFLAEVSTCYLQVGLISSSLISRKEAWNVLHDSDASIGHAILYEYVMLLNLAGLSSDAETLAAAELEALKKDPERYNSCIDDMRRVIGDEHEGNMWELSTTTIRYHSQLAMTREYAKALFRTGKSGQAEKELREVLDLVETVSGEDYSAQQIKGYSELAEMLRQQFRNEEADSIYTTTLTALERLYPGDTTFAIHDEYVNFLMQVSRYTEAVQYLERFSMKPDDASQEDSTWYIKRANWILCSAQLGKMDLSRVSREFKDLADLMEASKKQDSLLYTIESIIVLFLRLMMDIYNCHQRETLIKYEELVEESTNLVGPHNKLTLTLKKNSCDTLKALGLQDKFREVSSEAYEMSLAMYGEQHDMTCETAIIYAQSLAVTDPIKASNIMEAMLNSQESIHEKLPITRYAPLSGLHQTLGKYGEAVSMLDVAMSRKNLDPGSRARLLMLLAGVKSQSASPRIAEQQWKAAVQYCIDNNLFQTSAIIALDSLKGYAATLERCFRFDEAFGVLQTIVKRQRENDSQDSHVVLEVEYLIACNRNLAHDLHTAEILCRDNLARYRWHFPGSSTFQANTLVTLAEIQQKKEQYAEAMRSLAAAEVLCVEDSGQYSVLALRIGYSQAYTLFRLGKVDDALTACQENLDRSLLRYSKFDWTPFRCYRLKMSILFKLEEWQAVVDTKSEIMERTLDNGQIFVPQTIVDILSISSEAYRQLGQFSLAEEDAWTVLRDLETTDFWLPVPFKTALSTLQQIYTAQKRNSDLVRLEKQKTGLDTYFKVAFNIDVDHPWPNIPGIFNMDLDKPSTNKPKSLISISSASRKLRAAALGTQLVLRWQKMPLRHRLVEEMQPSIPAPLRDER